MDTATSTLWSAWRVKRDDAAFEALVRPELPALYDAARRQGLGTHDAEDVVQASLSELARERSSRPAQVGIGAWLMRSVRLKSLGSARSARRRRAHEGRARTTAPGCGHDQALDVHDEVERALESVGETDRQILLFRFLYDLDYREIAYVLGTSENACRIRVHRASGRLRERIGPRAPTLLALIPLGDLPGSTGAIAAATKTAGAAGGIWTTIVGGGVMGTGLKMAGAAAVAAALTAGAFVATEETYVPSMAEPYGEIPETAGLSSDAPPPTLAARQAPARTENFDPSAEELAWLKLRLKDERARRARAVVRPSDTGIQILERVFDHGLDAWPLLGDFKRFREHVRTGDGPPRTFSSTGEASTPINLAPAVRDGARVIEFGPGTFAVTGLSQFQRGESTGSLEFRGAGKDKTTLVMGRRGTLMVTKELTNLRFRGMTIDYGTQGELLDVRDATAVILEDVRLQNWSGGGYSAAIGIAGRAYLGCRDCEFQSTEGRGGQFAVNFRGPGVAVFERCTFRDLRCAIMGDRNSKGSPVLLRDCTFIETALTDSRIEVFKGKPGLEIRVRGGRAVFLGRGLAAKERSARWGAAWATELTNIPLEANQNSLTPAGLAAILRNLELPHGELLHALTVTRFHENAASALQLSTRAGAGRRSRVYSFTRTTDGWHLKHQPRGGGHAFGLSGDERPRDMLTLLETSGVPVDFQVRGAFYQMVAVKSPRAAETGHTAALALTAASGSRALPILLDADTGRWLNNPGR